MKNITTCYRSMVKRAIRRHSQSTISDNFGVFLMLIFIHAPNFERDIESKLLIEPKSESIFSLMLKKESRTSFYFMQNSQRILIKECDENRHRRGEGAIEIRPLRRIWNYQRHMAVVKHRSRKVMILFAKMDLQQQWKLAGVFETAAPAT